MIRDIQNVDDDIIRMKREIKSILINDPDVIEALHNPDLNPDEPDSFVDVNIFDYIRIPGATDEVKTFLCFDVKDERLSYTNDYIKSQLIIFETFVEEDDIKTDYGMARHDLLSYLIRDLFNYTNRFGLQWTEISNVPGVTDSHYSTRIITFKTTVPNSPNRAVKVNKYEFD